MAYSSTHPPQEDLTSFIWGNGPGCLSSVDEVNTSSSRAPAPEPTSNSTHYDSSFSSIFSRDVSQNISRSSSLPRHTQSHDDTATPQSGYESSASEDDQSRSTSPAPRPTQYSALPHTRRYAIAHAMAYLQRARYIPPCHKGHKRTARETARERKHVFLITQQQDGTVASNHTIRDPDTRYVSEETQIHFPTYNLRVSGGISTRHQIHNYVKQEVKEYLQDWAAGLEVEPVSSIRVVVDSHSIRVFVAPLKKTSWAEEDEGYEGETEKLSSKDFAKAVRLGRWNEIMEDEEPSYFDKGFVV